MFNKKAKQIKALKCEVDSLSFRKHELEAANELLLSRVFELEAQVKELNSKVLAMQMHTDVLELKAKKKQTTDKATKAKKKTTSKKQRLLG